MKKFWKEFLLRGLVAAAGGPVVLAIIYGILGATPYGGEKAPAFYKRMMQQSDANEYGELYAAALLLDKDLGDFVASTVGGDRKVEKPSGNPKHYQEAWMI